MNATTMATTLVVSLPNNLALATSAGLEEEALGAKLGGTAMGVPFSF